MKHLYRRFVCCATALLVAGCATVAPTGVPLSGAGPSLAAHWQAHEKRLRGLTAFTLDARVAASGSFGVTGSLHWVEDNGRFKVHFSGPFGSNAVDISGDRFVVDIRSRDHHYVTSTPERFLLKHFGWTLPLQGLRYWVRGLPAPMPAATAPTLRNLNSNGQLVQLEQAGWRISYSDYVTVKGYALPTKLSMHGQGTEFHIAIDAWSPAPAGH